MDRATEKFQRGLQRLAEAGDDRDMLGQAVLSLHGALEDSFRDQLASHPGVPLDQRHAVQDRQQVQWKGLLDLMQRYGNLSDHDRRTIQAMNGIRQRIAHGGDFDGARGDVEAYAAFVQRLTGVRAHVAPARRDEPQVGAEPAQGHSWLALAWRGQGHFRLRALFGVLLAMSAAEISFALALAALRLPAPLDTAGWICLGLAALLLLLGLRGLTGAVLRLGVRRLLIWAGIGYTLAVVAFGVALPTGERGASHWLASVRGVAGMISDGAYGALRGIAGAPEAVRRAHAAGQRPKAAADTPWASSARPTAHAGPSAADEGQTDEPAASPTAEPSLQVGDRVRVAGTAGAPLRGRAAPSADAGIVARFPAGSELEIVDGPEAADGRVWWRVRLAGRAGWCAAEFLAPAASE